MNFSRILKLYSIPCKNCIIPTSNSVDIVQYLIIEKRKEKMKTKLKVNVCSI